MKKVFRTLLISALISVSMSTIVFAGQSSRWVGSGERWQVSDNAGGFIKDSWYQDEVSGKWFMLGAEDGSIMYAGLITDQSTGKSYLLNTNHDGSYGAMLTTDGVYNLNGQQVYLQFDQAHQGFYGAITSGLSEARNAGIGEKELPSIPTDTAQPDQPTPPKETPPKETKPSSGDPILDMINNIPPELMDECIEYNSSNPVPGGVLH